MPSGIFKKKSSSTLPADASSYLLALSQADARTRNKVSSSATSTISTPALSLSSSLTASTKDTFLTQADKDDIENIHGLSLPAKPPTSDQIYRAVHTEFGHCSTEEFRRFSSHLPNTPVPKHVDRDPPYYVLLSTYISYLILIVLGHVRDFLGKRFYPKSYADLMPSNGYAPLTSDFDSFYTRRLKLRMNECFNQPVTGVAGRTIQILDRYSPDYNHTQISLGTISRALNISSYNYLGFAQAQGGVADAVEVGMKLYGVTTCGSRLTGGSSDLHTATETLVAKFLGTEDSLITSMGFATNSTIIPALVSKGCLVISDELNHASIRFGVRQSGAHVKMFKHNDTNALEALLRETISQGQPKTHRPWKKILVIVEGLFSMEGTMVDLPRVLELKKKYKFNLFVDEAHSIGGIGKHGRGIADYFNIDPEEIDVLMGTFSKSFGAAGGYIGGKKCLIDRLRIRSYSGVYAEAMSPPVMVQIIASMASIMGVQESELNHSVSSGGSTLRLASPDSAYYGPITQRFLPTWLPLPYELSSGLEGRERLRRLSFNCYYLHRGLDKLGFIVYGHPCSPVVPLLIYQPGKMIMFHRMMKDRKTPIVTVPVAYPATPLITSRIRLCVSAAHTKEDIDEILRACNEVGDVLDLKHGISKKERWTLDEVCGRAVELVNLPDHDWGN
ncbi:serine palmitoyltransferase 2 [Rhodocollybia butyracea]|uniref:serine C-palmitoyltransferase n=1 Tax=Rhodocollybia butyracea TaxID=206335 RepID=A0A9P5Q4W5_9AGAR|nr:serine palmitoyltransferase 2 [Rhodocollybia butyracea]